MRCRTSASFRASRRAAPKQCERILTYPRKPNGWKKFISVYCRSVCVRHLRIFGAWHKHRYHIAVSMPASCSGHGKTVEPGEALIERCGANNFVTDVEEARGSTADAACTPKTKLVEDKPEMVCAAGLFHCDAAVSR